MTYPLPQHPKTGRRHQYREAFCLMLYRDRLGNEEWIWNSRDGVAPFGVRSQQGADACHVQWHRDRYLPNHVPEVGSRIFVDLTPARARELAGINYDLAASDNPKFRELHPDRGAFVQEVALSYLEQFWPCTPTLVEVTPELHQQFADAAAAKAAEAAQGRREHSMGKAYGVAP